MLVFITQWTQQRILNSFCFIYIKCQYLKIDSLSSRKVLPVVSSCVENYLGMSFVQFLLGWKCTRPSSGCDSRDPVRCEKCCELLPSPPPEGKIPLLWSLTLSSSANTATRSFWVGWPGRHTCNNMKGPGENVLEMIKPPQCVVCKNRAWNVSFQV